jgi:hypothetical protein
MKGKRKRIIAAVAVIAALAAGGVAFTNTIDTSATYGANAGYGTVSVHGGPALSSVVYGFNSDGSQIMSVNLTFAAALNAGQYVSVAFDSTSGTVGGGGTILTPLSASSCLPAPAIATTTTVTCTINNAGAGAPTDQALNLDVLVKDNSGN